MLDINLFREDRGGNPDLVRESQLRRYADAGLVDRVCEADAAWREARHALDMLNGDFNAANKRVAAKKKAKENADEEITAVKAIAAKIAAAKAAEAEAAEAAQKSVAPIGNLVHHSVPVHDDEDNNVVERTWGVASSEGKPHNHVDLMYMAGLTDLEKGQQVAGNRGYFLKGCGVLLNQALINYATGFLARRQYTPLQTPFFMKKDMMAKCAQLSEFDEALYHCTGDGDEKYMIATSEQPICCMHAGDWIDPKSLPIRYAGLSTCFRKEAGSHGRDTAGIFRVHQFEKVEQFVITSPDGDDSWRAHEEMIGISEEFYQSLGLPYQVINIVSGALNDAAAKKYDLEAWFPASKTFRELVSASNCTDYQSRRLEVRYGFKKAGETKKQYVHMLNSTLTATERTLCCIVENYQTDKGIVVPEVLRPFMMGVEFIPFVRDAPEQPAPKKSKGGGGKGGKGGDGGAKKGGDGGAKKGGDSKTGEKGASGGAAGGKGKGKGGDAQPKGGKGSDVGKGKQQQAAGGGKKDKKKAAPQEPPVELVVPSKSGATAPFSKSDARALRMFCTEAQVNHNVVEADSAAGAAAGVGAAAVPRLVDLDGTLITQPVSIMRHLAAKKGNPMFPNGADAAAIRVEQLLEWQATTLRPSLTGTAGSGAAPGCLASLEGWLKESAGKYITGKGFTAADIAIAMDLADASVEGYAKVGSWLETMRARPSYAVAVEA